jgi:hypothetical protein
MDCYRAFDHMNELFARLCTTEDAREGVEVFLENRKSDWKERQAAQFCRVDFFI